MKRRQWTAEDNKRNSEARKAQLQQKQEEARKALLQQQREKAGQKAVKAQKKSAAVPRKRPRLSPEEKAQRIEQARVRRAARLARIAAREDRQRAVRERTQKRKEKKATRTLAQMPLWRNSAYGLRVASSDSARVQLAFKLRRQTVELLKACARKRTLNAVVNDLLLLLPQWPKVVTSEVPPGERMTVFFTLTSQAVNRMVTESGTCGAKGFDCFLDGFLVATLAPRDEEAGG